MIQSSRQLRDELNTLKSDWESTNSSLSQEILGLKELLHSSMAQNQSVASPSLSFDHIIQKEKINVKDLSRNLAAAL